MVGQWHELLFKHFKEFSRLYCHLAGANTNSIPRQSTWSALSIPFSFFLSLIILSLTFFFSSSVLRTSADLVRQSYRTLKPLKQTNTLEPDIRVELRPYIVVGHTNPLKVVTQHQTVVSRDYGTPGNDIQVKRRLCWPNVLNQCRPIWADADNNAAVTSRNRSSFQDGRQHMIVFVWCLRRLLWSGWSLNPRLRMLQKVMETWKVKLKV